MRDGITCTGNDSGLAIDRLPELKTAGPYKLVFRLQSRAAGPGEIFWTTDPSTKLQKGTCQAFEVNSDGEWHDVSISIDTKATLHGLRIDPCSAPGTVKIKGLSLQDASGKQLHSWP